MSAPKGKSAPLHRENKLSPSRTVSRKITDTSVQTTSIREKFNGWRLGISIDSQDIFKVLIIAALMVLFTILQTTLFARFRPFGAVPDLMLPFVIATAAIEKEKWGAVTALIAAYVIDAAGGTTVTLLPLLYVPAAIAVGLLTTHRLRDSFSVAAVYTVITSVLRGATTFAIVMLTVHKISAEDALYDRVLPEIAANIVIAAFPQIVTRLCLRPFHKTRAERTGKV